MRSLKNDMLQAALLMPVVQKEIRSAEYKIKTLTGIRVIMTVSLDEGVAKEPSTLQMLARTIVHDKFNIDFELLKIRSRETRFVNARKVYSWICAKHIKMKVTEIARSLDMDHTSILHYLKEVREEKQENTDAWEVMHKIFTEFDLRVTKLNDK